MKKTVAVLIVICVMALTGCAAKTANDISVFVAPADNGGATIIPAEAPSAALPVREKNRRTMPMLQYEEAPIDESSQDSGETVYTSNMKYEIEGNYFVSEELTFAMPEGWKLDNFNLRINQIGVEGYALRQFLFYLADSQSDENALIMKIDCITGEYESDCEISYGRRLGASYDGSHVYILAAVTGTLSEEFGDSELYGSVLEALTRESFNVQINV
ncbi:MAG: hypothetical protein RR998_02355 [Oscillospiraceae bacterium]